jgi:hypothetical protein
LLIVKLITLVVVLIELEMLVYNYKKHVEDIHLLLLVVLRHQLRHFAFLTQRIINVLLLPQPLLVKQYILDMVITMMLIAVNLNLGVQLIQQIMDVLRELVSIIKE